MSRLLFGGRSSPRALRLSVISLAAVVLTGVLAVWGLPLAARVFVWGLRLMLDGVLWLALSISTGTDLWTIAGTAGQVVASSLVTPQAIGGAGVLLLCGVLAFIGLRRLFDSGKESVQ